MTDSIPDIATAATNTMAASARPRLCVVCPCHNEQEVIELFHQALKETLATLPGLDHQIIFVDDGSSDGTLDRLNELARSDPSVRVYSLSRNFGHQVALSAGLDVADGDAVIMMDSDMQHPPSLIPEMVRHWRDGHDVVSTVRRSSGDVGWFKKFSSAAFYWVISGLTSTPIPSGVADFCLLSRRAHQALLSMPERHRFLRGMVSWMGFARTFIDYQAAERGAGRSSYNLPKMVGLAMDAAFSFSTTPIRIATRLGVMIVILGAAYFFYAFIKAMWFGGVVPGWTSLICIVLILGGANLAFIGLIGGYVARVFEQVKGRPLYFFKQTPRSTGPSGQRLRDAGG